MEALVQELGPFRGEPPALPSDPRYPQLVAAAAAGNPAVAGRRPCLVLRPAGAEDVAAGIRAAGLARSRGIIPPGVPPLTLCGGGHSEMCVMDGSILMHMARMDDIVCDGDRGTVEIGAGCKLGAVKAAAAAAGLALPLGTFTGVGVGSILHGGVGRLTRLHGLSLDNLVSAEVVLPEGGRRSLGPGSEGEDAELFWGLRGGGASLAVATRLTLRGFPYPAPLFGRSVRPLPDTAGLHAIDEALRTLPRHQQADLLLGWTGGDAVLGLFPHSATGEPFEPATMAALGLAAGDLAVGTADGVPYHSLEARDPGWVAHLGGEVAEPDTAAPKTGQAECVAYVRQLFMDEMGEEAWGWLADAVRGAPNQLCNIMLQQGGGAIRDIDPDACAFNHRAWEYSVVICGLWLDEAEAGACRAWADGVDARLRPAAAGQYAADFDPFARPEAAGAEARACFPRARGRLATVKARVDPEGLLGAGPSAHLA